MGWISWYRFHAREVEHVYGKLQRRRHTYRRIPYLDASLCLGGILLRSNQPELQHLD